MTNRQKFKHALDNHPGVAVVLMLNGLGFVAGATRLYEPFGLTGGLFGVALTSVFWIPVLITAWTGRNGYEQRKI